MATLVPFQPRHLTDALALWNGALGASFPLRWELLVQNTVADPNFFFPGSFLALWRGEPAGFVFSKRQQVPLGPGGVAPRGHISALAVAPRHQGHGVGSKLLAAAEGALGADGVTSLRLGGDTGHFFPGVPEPGPRPFFARRGYTFATELETDLVRDLAGFTAPGRAEADLARAGATTALAQPEHVPPLREFLGREFPGRWAWELEQYLARGGHPGDYLLLWQEGAVQGFARLYDGQSRPVIGPSLYWAPLLGGRCGGLGPMGIARGLRQYGLGLALLSRAVAELQRRGVERMVIDWTTLVGFYGKLGFQPWKRYAVGRRDL